MGLQLNLMEIKFTIMAKQINVLEKINKIYGEGSIQKARGEGPIKGIERFSLPFPGLNEVLGGGIPRGRIIEVFGPEASSKTTFCLHVIAAGQKETGQEASFIDAEHSLNLEYAENLDVDLEKLNLSQPDCGEEALEILEFLLDANQCVIVIDSVAALVPQAEIDGEMGDSKMGLQARLMSQAMRKIVAKVEKSKTTVIFTNQLRETLMSWGNPEVTTGGKALKFYASIRVDIRGSTKIMKGETEVVGNIVKIKAVKNKTAPPFRFTEMQLYYGEGYSQAADLLKACVDLKIIDSIGGGWHVYGETKLGQGQANVVGVLSDNLELMDELKSKIKEIESNVENKKD